MEQFVNRIILGDCLEKLKELPDKSVNLVCIDPPYNINKDDWDKLGMVRKGYGGNKENNVDTSYYEWMGQVFELLARKLKDNGSLFFFHNDFRMMAQLDLQIQQRTNLVYRQFLVWNKRFNESPKKGFLDGFIVRGGLTNFNKMAEYILFYTFDNSHKLKEVRTQRGIKQTTISKEILSKSGKMTGWYSNLETGKNMPTPETIKPITKHLGLTLEDIVPKFNNQKTHHSVWNYDLDSKKLGHLTPKPISLLENIILHTTDEGDIVLDCFMGSGSTAVAAVNTGRRFIGIEKEVEYCDIAEERIKNAVNNS